MKNAQITDQPQLLTAEGDNILDFSATLRELRKHVVAWERTGIPTAERGSRSHRRDDRRVNLP